jgi:hypothetical protein
MQDQALCESLAARADSIGSMNAEDLETYQEELGSINVLLDGLRTGSISGGMLRPDGAAGEHRGPEAAEIKTPLLLM